MDELQNPYFDIQAELGITKHPGGVKSTRALIELCHITKDSYVLDVGCGVGRSACFIAEKTGCRIIGIDISERMVDRARERAKRKGLEDKVTFIVANAEGLPFDAEIFDAVITESVTAFTDKTKSISEYVRVAKRGGYIGLNETTWLKKPTPELQNYLKKAIGDVQPENCDTWKALLKSADLKEVTAESYQITMWDQAISEMKLTGLGDSMRAYGRMFTLFFDKPYRKALINMTKNAKRPPKGLMSTFGYGIYVGKKGE